MKKTYLCLLVLEKALSLNVPQCPICKTGIAGPVPPRAVVRRNISNCQVLKYCCNGGHVSITARIARGTCCGSGPNNLGLIQPYPYARVEEGIILGSCMAWVVQEV